MSSNTLNTNPCIGPVFSGGGFKNWHLYLCQKEIIGVPLGLWPSIKAGLFAGIGLDPGDAYGRRNEDQSTTLIDTGDKAWRRYPLSLLEYVHIKRVLTANEIYIKRYGKEADLYGIGQRAHTDEVRYAFRHAYPTKYKESGF